jgi:hypothetical protein
MDEIIEATLPLIAWRGEKATYHLVEFEGEVAEAIATHAALHRLEFGKQRGFGSVKCYAKTGTTRWKTSVFPVKVTPDEHQATHALRPSTRNLTEANPGGRAEGAGGAAKQRKNWILLISKKVMRAEDLAEGDTVELELELL